jgi:outer membrane lipopolysaccharide assembly protein LptE/RlpB
MNRIPHLSTTMWISRTCHAGLVLVLAWILCWQSGCGYSLSGRGSYLPEYIKKIAIPIFKNNTPRYELEQRITRAVIDTMVKRGKYQIVTDESEADAVLSAEINSFNYTPVQFDAQGSANRYEIIITAKVTFTDKAKNKVLFENPSFSFRSQYEIPEGADITYFDKESVAILDISRSFAETLVSSILEAF